MTLCRSWAVDLGSSTSSTTLTVISGSVAIWLISRIALATICSRSWVTTLISETPQSGMRARFCIGAHNVRLWGSYRISMGSVRVPLPQVSRPVGVGPGEERGDACAGATVAVRGGEARQVEGPRLPDGVAHGLRSLRVGVDHVGATLPPALARSDIHRRDFQGGALDQPRGAVAHEHPLARRQPRQQSEQLPAGHVGQGGHAGALDGAEDALAPRVEVRMQRQ